MEEIHEIKVGPRKHHRILIKNGKVVLLDHDEESLKAEAVMEALTGKCCPCVKFMRTISIAHSDHAWDIENLPPSLLAKKLEFLQKHQARVGRNKSRSLELRTTSLSTTLKAKFKAEVQEFLNTNGFPTYMCKVYGGVVKVDVKHVGNRFREPIVNSDWNADFNFIVCSIYHIRSCWRKIGKLVLWNEKPGKYSHGYSNLANGLSLGLLHDYSENRKAIFILTCRWQDVRVRKCVITKVGDNWIVEKFLHGNVSRYGKY